MDHKQLRAFLTIAETGNMTRAAEMLNVVQSAVSRQIQLLEDDLGVKLFRERHGIALTGAGKSLQGAFGDVGAADPAGAATGRAHRAVHQRRLDLGRLHRAL